MFYQKKIRKLVVGINPESKVNNNEDIKYMVVARESSSLRLPVPPVVEEDQAHII